MQAAARDEAAAGGDQAGAVSGRSGGAASRGSRGSRPREHFKSRVITTGEEAKHYLDQRRLSCAVHFVCSTIGIVLAVVNNEVDHANQKAGGSDQSGISTMLKAGIVALSLVGLLFLYKYYDSRISQERLSGIRLAPGVSYASLRATGFMWAFLWDVLIMLPMPMPGLDFDVTVWNKGLGRSSVYTSDTVLCIACMILRTLYLPRFYGECLSDLGTSGAAAFARFNKIAIDESFTIKYVLANSLDCVVFISGLSVVMFAYAMMVFERPVADATLGHYMNCVWLIVITMTTVGYGDEYPTTFLGRLVSIMASIAAVVMLAITVNLVITKLSLSRSESKVVEIMDKVAVRKEMKLCAAVAIQRWARAYISFIQEGTAHASKGQGYMQIPDMKSKERVNQDRREFVWSNLPLLEALNVLKAAKRSSQIAHMRCDLHQLAGDLEVTLPLNASPSPSPRTHDPHASRGAS